jgi:hypothetical protein
MLLIVCVFPGKRSTEVKYSLLKTVNKKKLVNQKNVNVCFVEDKF